MDTNKIKIITERLREMRLPIMVEQVIMMVETNELGTLPVEDVLDRMTANEFMSRKNNSIDKLKKKAGLTQLTASMNDLNYSPERELNQSIINQLATNDYIKKYRNIVIMGTCGNGRHRKSPQKVYKAGCVDS